MKASAPSARLRRFHPLVVVLACFLVMTLEGYDIQAFGVAAPQLVAQLALNAAQQGWAASAAMFGLVVGAFAGGRVSDRIGRKPVLVAAMAVFGACSAWTAASHGYADLLAARFATGVGMGAALPILIAVAAEISPIARRGAATSAICCGMPAGGAIVAFLAKAHLDWRVLFVVGGALPLILIPLVLALVPETRPEADETADRRLFGALFGGRRASATLLLWAGNLLTLLVMYLLLNWLPSLVVAKGHTAADGAAAAMAFNLVGVTGALLLGFVTDKVGVRWSMLTVYAGLAAAMTLLGRAVAMPQVLQLSGAAGFLVLGAQYVLYSLAPRLYPPQVRAAGAGAAVGVGRFGSILGPLLAGQLRQAGWSGDQVLSAMLPIALAAGAAVFALTFLLRREPAASPVPTAGTSPAQ